MFVACNVAHVVVAALLMLLLLMWLPLCRYHCVSCNNVFATQELFVAHQRVCGQYGGER